MNGTQCLGIGELSRRTGVSVRTIRYYCDEGLITAQRTTGGHRVFDASAVDLLQVVRRLRALGLGLVAIEEVLQGRVSVGDAVDAQSAAVEGELAELQRLRGRLRAVAAVGDGGNVRDGLIALWRRVFDGAMASPAFDDFVDMTVPVPSSDLAPSDVLAYAELAELVLGPALGVAIAAQLWQFDLGRIVNRRTLVAGVSEACEMAAPAVSAGRAPSSGPALDRFVAAHADARGVPDSPRFRQALAAGTDHDPLVARYWGLVRQVTAGRVTGGDVQRWLHAGLCATP
jgi:DNA-binding transcriptional MerR regulator